MEKRTIELTDVDINKEHEVLCLCKCANTEHQFIFRYENYPGSPELGDVYVSTYLSDYRTFFQRLWVGIKYAFGYRSRYGDFDEFIFRPKDWEKVINIGKYLYILNENEKENGTIKDN